MKSFLLSDNHDTLAGMRLAGIEGVVIHTREEVLEVLKAATIDPEIGIIIVTEKIVDLVSDEIMEYKLKNKKPLLVEIPDRHGNSKIGETIDRYVSEAIGVKL